MEDTKIAFNESGISTSNKEAMWFWNVQSISVDLWEGKFRFRVHGKHGRKVDGLFSSFTERNDFVIKLLHAMQYDNIPGVITEFSQMLVNSRVRIRFDTDRKSPLPSSPPSQHDHPMDLDRPGLEREMRHKTPISEWREKLSKRKTAINKGKEGLERRSHGNRHSSTENKVPVSGENGGVISNKSNARWREECNGFKDTRRFQGITSNESDRHKVPVHDFPSWRSLLRRRSQGSEVDSHESHPNKSAIETCSSKHAVDHPQQVKKENVAKSKSKEVELNPKFTAETNDRGQIVLNIFLEDGDLSTLMKGNAN